MMPIRVAAVSDRGWPAPVHGVDARSRGHNVKCGSVDRGVVYAARSVISGMAVIAIARTSCCFDPADCESRPAEAGVDNTVKVSVCWCFEST